MNMENLDKVERRWMEGFLTKCAERDVDGLALLEYVNELESEARKTARDKTPYQLPTRLEIMEQREKEYAKNKRLKGILKGLLIGGAAGGVGGGIGSGTMTGGALTGGILGGGLGGALGQLNAMAHNEKSRRMGYDPLTGENVLPGQVALESQ